MSNDELQYIFQRFPAVIVLTFLNAQPNLHEGFLKYTDPEYKKGRISLKIDDFNYQAF